MECLVVSLGGGSFGGGGDPSLPIAAARAGAIGILDLSGLADERRAASAVERLSRLARGRCGLLLSARRDAVQAAAAEVVDGSGFELDLVLLAVEDGESLPALAQAWRTRARRVGVVATCEAHARLALEAECDLIVARGHEAGGVVGEETTFILMQRLLAAGDLPVLAWGGIGPHVAAGCLAAGAAGVVLDWQLALTRESSLTSEMRARIARMDGSETLVTRLPDGRYFRSYVQPGWGGREVLETIAAAHPEDPRAWQRDLERALAADVPAECVVPVGQDAALAARWPGGTPTVASALAGLRAVVERNLRGAAEAAALAPDGPLARSHGTRYPVVQGPMTRVSDVPEFCAALQEGGGLPFQALALMRGPACRELLQRTSELAGKAPWGVGILGFIDRDLKREQLDAIEEVRPPFAIIAGGRPDQAASMEARGIATYLHVPSPGMLETFVAEGARRLIFEGRECGGHIGPRTSFVLWEQMIRVLEELDLSPEQAAEMHVLFAGGIHDERSAATVATLAQPLVARGMKIGVLMGSAYLFTREIVETAAVVEGFQAVAIEADETVTLETGPGHATRCAPSEFSDFFEAERARRVASGDSAETVRDELERLNLGRLRAASKGIVRRAAEAGGASELVELDEAEQRREGMYMVGQLVALMDAPCTIRELHERVSAGAVAWLERGAEARSEARATVTEAPSKAPEQLDIAIVGMSCMLPGASDPEELWTNILAKRDLIEEVPPDRFDADRWYDPERGERDKIYTKSGGFMREILFDPLKYGIPPASLSSIEPVQLLALELVDKVLTDAGCGGYAGENPLKETCSIILGAGGGAGELSTQYAFRSGLPHYIENIDETILGQLPEWTEDSFAGILMNVIAGRVANRYDLGGVNFTVDAACASSLAAVYVACRELAAGTSDLVIAGGCDTVQSPFGYLCFATAGALSPRGRSRAFDASADGIAISEGLAAVALKRLDDAERDGDRVYAVIRAAAGGSDGRSMGMTAPRAEGQLRTLRRAYDQAGFSAASVGLFEAHGTGTALGDRTECTSLNSMLTSSGAGPQTSAIGSVKSNIGHTKCTAGVAGLMKAALALHHRVLPPTLHVESIEEGGPLDGGPLYASTELRPWIRGADPRRAGISAFGFGGTNFHVVLEDYEDEPGGPRTITARDEWPAELFTFASETSAKVADGVRRFANEVRAAREAGVALQLGDLACTLHRRHGPRAAAVRAAVVATDVVDLLERLEELEALLAAPDQSATALPPRVHLARGEAAEELTFLFPGQGSQHPDMLRDVACEFSEVRGAFQRADRVLEGDFERTLSGFVFPPPTFDEAERAARIERLKATDVAQPALGAANLGILRLLESLRIRPTTAAGHSYGELVALCAAGAFDEDTLHRLSRERGRAMAAVAEAADAGTMLAVRADEARLRPLLEGREGVWIANLNSPRQTVISGATEAVAEARGVLEEAGLSCVAIPVACAFHTPLMDSARERFARTLEGLAPREMAFPVTSNRSAQPYGDGAAALRSGLEGQILDPVRFTEQIENLYAEGQRVFCEVGPNGVLTRLVGQILGDRPHTAVATQPRGEDGMVSLLEALGTLFVQGIPMVLDRLYDQRSVEALELRRVTAEAGAAPAAHLWRVNGAYARPVNAPPRRPQPEARLAGPPTGAAASPTVNPAESPMAPPTAPQSPVATPAQPPAGPALTSHAPPPVAGDPHAQFQETMRQFLETQAEVMAAFLGAPPQAPAAPAVPADAFQTPIGEFGAPLVKPVAQVAQPVISSAEVLPVADTAGASAPVGVGAAPVPSAADLGGVLLEVVSERTGYPADMLSFEADLEGDLGIDSIKRVEIIAAFRRAVLGDGEEPPAWFMERMTAARTMTEIVSGVGELVGQASVAAPVATATATTTAAAAPPAVDLGETLVEVVAERTGYPADMLSFEADLEGDLGIDSIKRVEIIAAFRRAVLGDGEEPPAWFMERMTAARTMTEIVSGVQELAGGGDPDPEPDPGAPSGTPRAVPSTATQAAPARLATEGAETAPRCVVRVVEAPLPPNGVDSVPKGVVVLTDSGRPLAGGLAEELCARGASVALLGADALSSRDAAQGALERVRAEHGPIAAVVHLEGLRPAPAYPGITADDWRRHHEQEIIGALHLLQALAPELENGASFTCLTAGGGDFGGEGEATQPWRGGLVGMLKCAAKEWDASRFRVVDLEREPVAGAADLLADEWRAEGPLEVGYRDGRRLGVQSVRLDLDDAVAREESARLDSSSVVLLTGGARGITAEIAIELARGFQPTLILLGRSPAPEGEEGPATAGIDDHGALRGALVADARAAGETVTPKDVEARLRHLLGRREIRATLEAIAETGATGVYLACDVRDDDALAALVEQVGRDHGPVTAIVHGAGVIEDKYIVDKSDESFARVVGTKLDPVLTLTRVLDPERLKLVMLFSSVAGFFGNPGQSDYAAANETLNRMARRLSDLWPAKVVALNWGPWRGAGMVTPEVARQFDTRGVGMVSVPAGRRAAWLEAFDAGERDVRVLIGDGPWTRPEPGCLPASLPLLAGRRALWASDGVLEVELDLDLERDGYLADHRIDGKAVLPFTVALTLLAEAAAAAFPERHVIRLVDVRQFNGIVLEGDARCLRLRVERSEAAHGLETCTARIVDPELPSRPLYQGRVILAAERNGRATDAPDARPAADFPLSTGEAYERWLFHGPLFQAIESLEAYDGSGISARVRASCPAECLEHGQGSAWMIDPVVLDAAPQLAILWSRATHDTTSLPNHVADFEIFDEMGGEGEIEVIVRTLAEADAHTFKADVWFLREGAVVARMLGLEGSSSAELNRLGGDHG
ncbi:MAG: SDR family oxidoreductase [Planctomycetota bacterium]|jgi:acyl transferase domain-containing protein/NAD(P)H-dependent flavin oxidoreductase YrpB (nitropropane dioxygenase family)/NAD(P)-dependent dehydrogenase (short-subunit alcohol dehydrogenase family)|nr:SDR family oxidoreductase [Planctomycetota bacterium]